MMEWSRSSFCESANSCIEVAISPALDRVYLRDSKTPHEHNYLVFTLSEWDAFVNGVKGGEFDP
jgi:Domain of unknown function (DUF397).